MVSIRQSLGCLSLKDFLWAPGIGPFLTCYRSLGKRQVLGGASDLAAAYNWAHLLRKCTNEPDILRKKSTSGICTWLKEPRQRGVIRTPSAGTHSVLGKPSCSKRRAV